MHWFVFATLPWPVQGSTMGILLLVILVYCTAYRQLVIFLTKGCLLSSIWLVTKFYCQFLQSRKGPRFHIIFAGDFVNLANNVRQLAPVPSFFFFFKLDESYLCIRVSDFLTSCTLCHYLSHENVIAVDFTSHKFRFLFNPFFGIGHNTCWLMFIGRQSLEKSHLWR